jgi:transposase InsO family protein
MTPDISHWRSSERYEYVEGLVSPELAWEARVLIEEWRRHYNRARPHSSLGYRPPAPEALANAEGGKTVPMARPQIGSGPAAAAMPH